VAKSSILEKILALHPPPVEEKPGPRWGKVTAAQRAALIKSQERAAVRRQARGRGRYGRPIGTRAMDRIAMVMLPGRWYAAGDLARATGEEKRRVGGTMLERGLVVRAMNKGWPGKQIGVGRTWRVREPKWLYRLTELGEGLREMCLLLN
jgi:hypothetical protein